MTLYTGQQFGDYRLTEYLGGGGFADVYLGEHIYLHTEEHPVRVAVKVLKGNFTAKEISDLRNEAQTIIRLKHPHIVPLITFSVAHVETQNIPFLVMNHAGHGSLDKHYPRGSKLPLTTIVTYMKQIAQALKYAHDHKVVHRDIKPANLLLGDNQEILLGDFGIAVIAHRTHSWEEQRLVGSWHYAAPEHFKAKAEPASDQYSLGVVVYEWLCGSLPFTGDFYQLGYQHNEVLPPPLHEKIPISPAIEAVVIKALAKDPNDRFENVMAFALALEQAWESRLSIGTPFSSYHCNDGKVIGLQWSFTEGTVLNCLVLEKHPRFRRVVAQMRNGMNGIVIATDPANCETWKWLPGRTHIAVRQNDTFKVWSIETNYRQNILPVYSGYAGGPLENITSDSAWRIGVEWPLDGYRFILKKGNTLCIHDGTRGKSFIFPLSHLNSISSIAWSSDGRWVVANSSNNLLQVWGTSMGNLLSSYDGHQDEVTTQASPNDAGVASPSTVCSDNLFSYFSLKWAPNNQYIASIVCHMVVPKVKTVFGRK